MSASRPNILIFMTDQEQAGPTRPGHPALTPNAERLAREGLRFERTYCPAPHCCPSRATFMSGLYPTRHQVWNNVRTAAAINTGLRPGVTLFSEGLKEAGYRLGFSGKWHVSNDEGPADRGWEVLAANSLGRRRTGPAWTDWYEAGLTSAAERAPGRILRPGWGDFTVYGEIDGGERGFEGLNDYRVVEAAREKLREFAAGADPWCLYVGTGGPHDPYLVPREFLDRYRPADVPLPPNWDDDLADKPGIYRRLRRQVWGQLTPDEAREAIRHYWAYCSLEDALLGEMLAALEATGQADNTLVVRLADHGDYAGAHGLFCKGVPAFNEAYQVPGILRWPAGISRPGRTVDDFVTLADFAPTFLELAGARLPARLTGRSLAPFFRGERPADWPDAVFGQLQGVELFYTQRSVRTREHKYVFNGFDEDELYDLGRDPHELRNVSADPAYRETKRSLVERMWRFAVREEDELLAGDDYITIALAPWGPAPAIREARKGKGG